jgi:hypothetical protein
MLRRIRQIRLRVIVVVVFLIGLSVCSSSTGYVHAQLIGECPNKDDIIVKHTAPGLKEALKEIVPDLYPKDEKFKKWAIVDIMPLKASPSVKYHELGIDLCGKTIADRSWFVEIMFMKELGEDPNKSAQKQLFLAKDKEKGWIAWYVSDFD